MSDHRPVSAEFDVQVRKVDNSEYDRHALDLVHRLGDFENSEEVPRLKVEETTVEFGDVRYGLGFYVRKRICVEMMHDYWQV